MVLTVGRNMYDNAKWRLLLENGRYYVQRAKGLLRWETFDSSDFAIRARLMFDERLRQTPDGRTPPANT